MTQDSKRQKSWCMLLAVVCSFLLCLLFSSKARAEDVQIWAGDPKYNVTVRYTYPTREELEARLTEDGVTFADSGVADKIFTLLQSYAAPYTWNNGVSNPVAERENHNAKWVPNQIYFTATGDDASYVYTLTWHAYDDSGEELTPQVLATDDVDELQISTDASNYPFRSAFSVDYTEIWAHNEDDRYFKYRNTDAVTLRGEWKREMVAKRINVGAEKLLTVDVQEDSWNTNPHPNQGSVMVEVYLDDEESPYTKFQFPFVYQRVSFNDDDENWNEPLVEGNACVDIPFVYNKEKYDLYGLSYTACRGKNNKGPTGTSVNGDSFMVDNATDATTIKLYFSTRRPVKYCVADTEGNIIQQAAPLVEGEYGSRGGFCDVTECTGNNNYHKNCTAANWANGQAEDIITWNPEGNTTFTLPALTTASIPAGYVLQSTKWQSNANTYSYAAGEQVDLSTKEISEVQTLLQEDADGQLVYLFRVVAEKETEQLTLTGGEKTYDGTSLAVTLKNGKGQDITKNTNVTYFTSEDGSAWTKVTKEIPSLTDAKTLYVKAQYNGAESNIAALVVHKRTVTLYTEDKTATFDGSKLDCPKVQAKQADDNTGFVGKDKLTSSGFAVTEDGDQVHAGTHAVKIPTDAETLKKQLNQDGRTHFSNYEFVTQPGRLIIKPATVTVTLTPVSRPYDGTNRVELQYSKGITSNKTNLKDNITVVDETALPTAGTAESCLGESLTVTADEPADTPLVQFISLTKGGKTLAQIKPGDYAVQYQVGPVNITRRALTGTITTGSAEKTYDGSALTEESYRQDNVTGLAGTDKIQVICTGSQTEIGSGENLCTITIVNAQGEDVTAYYDLSGLTVVPGTLTVTKAVPAPTDAPAPTDSHPEIARLIAEGKWGGTPTPAAAARVPQTGDNFALTTVAAVMLAALAALVVVVVLRRRKHNRT